MINMNILSWIKNKDDLENNLYWKRIEVEKYKDKSNLLEKWNKGYLDHIKSLENEMESKNRLIKKLMEMKQVSVNDDNENYFGFLNFEFCSDNPTEFLWNLSEYLDTQISNYDRRIRLIGYDYQPSLITGYVFNRNFARKTGWTDEKWEINYVLHDLDHELETLHMYGNEETLNKYIKQIEEINKELKEHNKELLK